MSTDLVVQRPQDFQMTIQEAVARRQLLVDFTRQCMVKGVDYGLIPGTDKPTLHKAGAEKLATLFGFSARLTLQERIADWTGEKTGGEPMFYVCYRYSIYKDDRLICEADGSCNSFEKKYRYRNADRTCPKCGAPAIRKSKEEYGGGYYCNAKSGGCGAKFPAGAPEIEKQETGKIINAEIFDMVNTIEKMSQKRALVGAILLAANASEFYTADLDDFIDTSHGRVSTDTGEIVDTEIVRATMPAKGGYDDLANDWDGNGQCPGCHAPETAKKHANGCKYSHIGLKGSMKGAQPATKAETATQEPVAAQSEPSDNALYEQCLAKKKLFAGDGVKTRTAWEAVALLNAQTVDWCKDEANRRSALKTALIVSDEGWRKAVVIPPTETEPDPTDMPPPLTEFDSAATLGAMQR